MKVNGIQQMIEADMTVGELVTVRGLDPARVVVEHNYNILPRDRWYEVRLGEDDNIEIVSFVGGG
ncbi:MAG: sulfur carrier protein ThiS [Candidatus Omnitrophica bacterium]|nr:sulfur carrier protein ThiS [Candidatus Omnitrophota bacterium]